MVSLLPLPYSSGTCRPLTGLLGASPIQRRTLQYTHVLMRVCGNYLLLIRKRGFQSLPRDSIPKMGARKLSRTPRRGLCSSESGRGFGRARTVHAGVGERGGLCFYRHQSLSHAWSKIRVVLRSWIPWLRVVTS